MNSGQLQTAAGVPACQGPLKTAGAPCLCRCRSAAPPAPNSAKDIGVCRCLPRLCLLQELWKRKQSDVLRFLLRVRCWEFRQLPGIVRMTRPSRPDKARRMGFKAKQGYVVYRVRVRRGGRKKPVSKVGGASGGKAAAAAVAAPAAATAATSSGAQVLLGRFMQWSRDMEWSREKAACSNERAFGEQPDGANQWAQGRLWLRVRLRCSMGGAATWHQKPSAGICRAANWADS